MSDSSRTKPERKEWPDDWSFEQRREESHTEAQGIAYYIIGDWHLAEDALQKAELALWEKMKAGKKVGRAEYFTIVRNKAVEAWRKKSRRLNREVSESDFDAPNDDGKVVPLLSKLPDKKTPQPDESAQRHAQGALLDAMHQWLRKVYPDGAEVFQIHILEDHSQAQTAKILGVTEETVKQRWKKARTRFRTHFPKAYDELFN